MISIEQPNIVVRKTLIKALPTSKQKKWLDSIYTMVTCRARDILEELLFWKRDTIDIRHPDGTIKSEVSPYSLEVLQDAFNLIISNGKSARSIRGPMCLVNCTTGLNSIKPSELDQCMRGLIESGILPFLEKWDKEVLVGYDFAAFQMAVSAIKSWSDRDDETIKNYNTLKEQVDKSRPDKEHLNIVRDWLSANKLFMTKRVVSKFSKFEWTTRLRNYPFEELRLLNEDASVWRVIFNWLVEEKKLEGCRQTACFTMPDVDISNREIQYGNNYVSFSLRLQSNGSLTVLIEDEEIETVPSRYFRMLQLNAIPERVRDKKGKRRSGCMLRYMRGNNSPLNESVTAFVSEITLVKKGEDYYFGIPLNVVTPDKDTNARWLASLFFSGEETVEWPCGVRIMGVDLGVSNPAACVVTESVIENVYGSEKGFIIGDIRDAKYLRQLKATERKIREAYEKIDDLSDILKGVKPPCEWKTSSMCKKKWLEECYRLVVPIIARIKRRMENFKQSLHANGKTCMEIPIDQGVCAEMLAYILLYKRYISLLKRWTYFGSPPYGKGATSGNKFKRHYRQLTHLKLDFRKKLACEIVRAARMNNASIIGIEDLEHFKPSREERSEKNEMLALWGKGELAKWIKHFAEQYGIIVIMIDPRYTSQTDPDTGYLGYRVRRDLYVDRSGTIEKTDSDIAAAENIAARIHCRNSNVPYMVVRKMKSGYIIENEKKSKQRECALRNMFGSNRMISDKGQLCSLPKGSKATSKEYVFLYKYEDGWFPQSIRKERTDNLAARARAIETVSVEKKEVNIGVVVS